jgi:hypothetical protein
VEGVWSGAFNEQGFAEAAHFFGTGVHLQQDRVIIVPSVALVDRVFTAQDPSGIVCSNSLPLLLAFSGVRLDPSHNYHAESYALLKGIEEYSRDFVVSGNPEVCCQQHYYHPFEIRDNQLRTLRRKPALAFEESYSGYLEALQQEMRLLSQNATHSARRYPMALLSTVSAGYDSTAATALAAEIGVAVAYTSKRSNSSLLPWLNRQAAIDDGTPIANVLGVTVRDLRSDGCVDDDLELAAYSSSTAEAETVFLKLAQDIRDQGSPAVVFTGYHGDKLWEAKEAAKYDSPEIFRGDTSGLNLAELRLVAGFVNVPVPFFFASDVEKIRRISRSAAMAKWSVGGDYDRPIPRRLLESKGVPRSAFGDRKRAVVKLATIPESIRLRESFEICLQNTLGYGIGSAQVRLLWGSMQFLFVRTSEVVLAALGVRLKVDHSPQRRFAGKLTLALFHWSVDARARNIALSLAGASGLSSFSGKTVDS